MNIDETTGLPELPEGMFWRVTHPKDYGTGGYLLDPPEDLGKLQVTLVKEKARRWLRSVSDSRKWWEKLIGRPKPSDEEVAEVVSVPVDSEVCKTPGKEGIRDAAAIVLDRYEERERIAALVGDYPPKKLDTTANVS